MYVCVGVGGMGQNSPKQNRRSPRVNVPDGQISLSLSDGGRAEAPRPYQASTSGATCPSTCAFT